MKANELMIGDWVKSKDKPVKINVARLYGMVYHYDSNATEEVQPIPLTEEMLLNNGFVLDGTDESLSIWNNEAVYYHIFGKQDLSFLISDMFGDSFANIIEYKNKRANFRRIKKKLNSPIKYRWEENK